MFHMTSKYFNIFNNKPPASWVTYITRDFLTCYSCSYYSSMLEHSLSRTIFLGPLEVWVTGSSINKATHYKITALLKNKHLCFFGDFFFEIKIADILNFEGIKYLGKGLSYLKSWGIGVNYCLNYGLSKLLLYFIAYRLDQLKDTKACFS